jgi:hypothetical protein
MGTAPQDPAAAQAPAAAPPPSIVEQQLEAQGDQQEADEIRALREKLRQATEAAAATDPEADDDNQRGRNRRDRDRAGADGQDDGDRDRRGRRNRDRGEGRGNVVEDRGDRIIIDLGGGNIFVEPVVPDEGERLLYGRA